MEVSAPLRLLPKHQSVGGDIYQESMKISQGTILLSLHNLAFPGIWNPTFKFFRIKKTQTVILCGNLNVWYFLGSTTLAQDVQTYYLLPNFYTDSGGFEGLQAWEGDATNEGYHTNTPDVLFNSTNTVVNAGGVLFQPHAIFAHPAPNQLSIIGWRSPYDDDVSITGYISDIDPFLGDGILWYINKGSTNLVFGALWIMEDCNTFPSIVFQLFKESFLLYCSSKWELFQ